MCTSHANVDITWNQSWLVQAPPRLSQVLWNIMRLAAVGLWKTANSGFTLAIILQTRLRRLLLCEGLVWR